MSFSNISKLFFVSSTKPSLIGCAGSGMFRSKPSDFTPGNISERHLAAAAAFGWPPSRQSENLKRDWRTGFENET